MKILALDIATHCGWATDTAFGVWNFTVKTDESGGMRLIRFKAKLLEMIEIEKIDLVVFERPGGQNIRPIIVQSSLQGVMMLVCEEKKIPYRGYSAGEIKKFGTGKGNAGKPAMINAARLKYGYTGEDDNEADALHLLYLAKEDYKLV